MHRGRSLSVVAFCWIAVLPVTVAAADAPAPEAARVEIALSDADGNTVQMVGQHLSWNDTHHLLETVGDRHHDVAIAMKRADDGKLSVALTYELDGAKVVERRNLKATLTEPVRIASEGGEVVFVVRAEPPRAKIEVGGTDDPLGGL